MTGDWFSWALTGFPGFSWGPRSPACRHALCIALGTGIGALEGTENAGAGAWNQLSNHIQTPRCDSRWNILSSKFHHKNILSLWLAWSFPDIFVIFSGTEKSPNGIHTSSNPGLQAFLTSLLGSGLACSTNERLKIRQSFENIAFNDVKSRHESWTPSKIFIQQFMPLFFPILSVYHYSMVFKAFEEKTNQVQNSNFSRCFGKSSEAWPWWDDWWIWSQMVAKFTFNLEASSSTCVKPSQIYPEQSCLPHDWKLHPKKLKRHPTANMYFCIRNGISGKWRLILVTIANVKHKQIYQIPNTLPETNSSHPKMDGWNTSFPLGWSIFRGELLASGRVIIWLLMGLGCTLSFCSHPTHTTLSHGSSLKEGGVSCWRCLTGAWFKTWAIF